MSIAFDIAAPRAKPGRLWASTFWTEEKIDQLRILVAEGKRTAELTDALKCSRCQLSGKLARLGIKLGRSSSKPKLPRKTKGRHHGANPFNISPFGEPKKPTVFDLAAEPSDGAVGFLNLDSGRCRWPISGVGLEMMFCGERADKDLHSPYCTRHHRRAYPKGRR